MLGIHILVDVYLNEAYIILNMSMHISKFVSSYTERNVSQILAAGSQQVTR